MRFTEFNTANNITLIKHVFEKALRSLIAASKKEAKIQQTKKQMTKAQAKNNHINSLKNTSNNTNPIAAALAKRPKR